MLNDLAGDEIETPLAATTMRTTTAWRTPTRAAGSQRIRTRRPGDACAHARLMNPDRVVTVHDFNSGRAKL